MSSTGDVAHAVGVAQGYPVPYSWYDSVVALPVIQTDVGLSRYARFSVPPVDPIMQPEPAPAVTLLSAVTGTSGASGNAQTITVSTSSIFNSGAAWIIDPGTANQEVIGVETSVIDDTHFRAIFMRNHSIGATILRLTSWKTRFLDLGIHNISGSGGVADITLIQDSALPPNVYVQYLLRGNTTTFSYVTDSVLFPWFSGGVEADSATPIPHMPIYDASAIDSNGIPTNGVVIDAGPRFVGSTGGRVTPSVQIQYLFTAWPEPDVSGIQYRLCWREL